MRVDEVLARKQSFSFEIFPPRGDLVVEDALDVAGELAKMAPDWISTTYSAGGSGNSENTVLISSEIQRRLGIGALSHLTCMGATEERVEAYMEKASELGVNNVLALRGDRVPGRDVIDFEHAGDLVSWIKGRYPDVCVGGACYPEGHVEAPSLRADVENMKRKVDAGADFLVTQLFFENEDFYRFRDECARARIKVPIVVGIMPFTSKRQIQRMAFTCGASIPSKVIKRIVACGDDEKAQEQAGIAYACEQLEDLAANGVDGIHIYTMNRPWIGQAVHDRLVECGYLC